MEYKWFVSYVAIDRHEHRVEGNCFPVTNSDMTEEDIISIQVNICNSLKFRSCTVMNFVCLDVDYTYEEYQQLDDDYGDKDLYREEDDEDFSFM